MTEEEIINKYEKQLIELYLRANTKSKKRKIAHDIILFSKMYYDHFDDEKTFIWDGDKELYDLLKNSYMSLVNDTIENRKLYSDIAKGVLRDFKKIKYPIYDTYMKHGKPLSPDDFTDVMFSFLDNYDPKLLNVFKKKLKNYEIFEGYTEDYNGSTYQLINIDKSIIFFTGDGKSSIYTASTLMHEFGHSYEFEIYNRTRQKEPFLDTNNKPYFEVTSRFFEYAFINYLIENKLYKKDTQMVIKDYNLELLKYMYEVEVLSKMKYIDIDINGMSIINDIKVSKYANKLKERLNFCYSSSEIGETINYRDAYIYGLGTLLSIYLYQNYKEDPNNFKKEFRNAILNYPHNGLEAFERVGITKESLLEGKVLRKTLKDSR